MDKVRCSNCRGVKKVAKLGGMMGDCNLCSGTGLINADDKPKVTIIEETVLVSDVVKQVANVAAIRIDKPNGKLDVDVLQPASNETPEAQVAVNNEPMVKVDGKKALYKRKTVAK